MNEIDRQLEPWLRKKLSRQILLNHNSCPCCRKFQEGTDKPETFRQRFRASQRRQQIIAKINNQKENRLTIDSIPSRVLFKRDKIRSQTRSNSRLEKSN